MRLLDRFLAIIKGKPDALEKAVSFTKEVYTPKPMFSEEQEQLWKQACASVAYEERQRKKRQQSQYQARIRHSALEDYLDFMDYPDGGQPH